MCLLSIFVYWEALTVQHTCGEKTDRGKAYYIAFSVLVPRLCELAYCVRFPSKSIMREQNLPDTGSWECLTRGLSANDLLCITCWRWTLLLWVLEAAQPSGATLTFFSLWKNILHFTTCRGCNIPVKLARTKKLKRMSGVLWILTTKQQRKQRRVSVTTFEVFCEKKMRYFTTKNLKTRRGFVCPLRCESVNWHCASSVNCTHHHTVIVQHLFMEDREINVI